MAFKDQRRINILEGCTDDLARKGWEAIAEQCCGRFDPLTGMYSVAPTFYRRGLDILRLDGGQKKSDGGYDPPSFDFIRLDLQGVMKLAYHLARAAYWCKPGNKGSGDKAKPEDVRVDVPHKVIQMMLGMLKNELPALPLLDGVITAPVFTKNGGLHNQMGYHKHSCLYLRPATRLNEAIPDSPSQAEIQRARDLLIGPQGVFWDFPYTNPKSDRALVLAACLQQFVRPIIDGPAPFYLVDKPVSGTGASTLCKTIARIATGTRTAPGPFNINTDDLVKKLDAALTVNPPDVMYLDNIVKRLEDGPLCTAITEPIWKGRILGKTKETSPVPIRCLWIGNGNNPDMDGAMQRRTLRIRLDAGQSNPERRKFQRKDFESWSIEHLPDFVWAALTLCQAWVKVGMPRPEARKTDFPSWSGVMQGILDVAGVDGFLENLESMHEDLDDEMSGLKRFILSWWEKFGASDVKAGSLRDLWENEESNLDLGGGSIHSQRIRLGRLLSGNRGKHFEIGDKGFQVKSGSRTSKSDSWRLVRWDTKGLADDLPEEDAKEEVPETRD